MSDTKTMKETNYMTGKPSGTKKGELFEAVEKNNQPPVTDIPGIPIEIKAEDFTVTNETKDGTVQVTDKRTGKVIGTLKPDGTIARNLQGIDRAENAQDR